MLVGQLRQSRDIRVTRVTSQLQLWSIVVCLGVNGCTDVSGGAVELSWKLRPASGSTSVFVDCDVGPVTRMRLDWEVGQVTGFATWPCTDYHGVTGFDLPPGSALLSVSPLCYAAAADTKTYTAPAPEQRTVIIGNTVSLGAVEVVVEVAQCTDQPCICK
jgi:hypothetical protein